MSGRSRIAFHRCFLGDSDTAARIPRRFPAQPDFPLWIEMRGAFGAHPRGKSFVEPQDCPTKPSLPGRRTIGAPFRAREPRRYLAFVSAEELFRIKQKFGFVVGDPAPVFHCASKTAGQRDLIQFRQWIGHAEIIVVVLQDLRRGFERVAPHLCLAFASQSLAAV